MSDTSLINEVFDRLNRNSKNLNNQELRHAKYSGWFITEAEKEADDLFWEEVKISTKSKSRRMKDIQGISELLMIILEGKIVGFDQDHITEIYARYNNKSELSYEPSLDSYFSEKERIKKYMQQMLEQEKKIINWIKSTNNFYILWALIAMNEQRLPESNQLTRKYISFMEKVDSVTKRIESNEHFDNSNNHANVYYDNSRGASTDIKQRTARLDALKKSVLEI